MTNDTIVITGIECMLPIGRNINECISAYFNRENKNLLSEIGSDKFGDTKVGIIPDEYFISDYSERDQLKYDRISMITSSVVGNCLKDAGIERGSEACEDVGIISGSVFGSMASIDKFYRTIQEQGPKKLDPMKFPFLSHNYPVSISSIQYGLKGPITAVVDSISSSLSALTYATYLLKQGQAKRMIVVGLDELDKASVSILKGVNYLNQANVFEPFDDSTTGTFACEGCSAILVELKTMAQQRNARIYGGISGFHTSFGNSDQSTCLAETIKLALHKSELDKEEADLLLLNGDGVSCNDAQEIVAIEHLIEEGFRFNRITAMKQKIGHYLGASGLTELGIALRLIDENQGYEVFSPVNKLESSGCRLKPKPQNLVLNNFGLAGNTTTVVVQAA